MPRATLGSTLGVISVPSGRYGCVARKGAPEPPMACEFARHVCSALLAILTCMMLGGQISCLWGYRDIFDRFLPHTLHTDRSASGNADAAQGAAKAEEQALPEKPEQRERENGSQSAIETRQAVKLPLSNVCGMLRELRC